MEGDEVKLGFQWTRPLARQCKQKCREEKKNSGEASEDEKIEYEYSNKHSNRPAGVQYEEEMVVVEEEEEASSA